MTQRCIGIQRTSLLHHPSSLCWIHERTLTFISLPFFLFSYMFPVGGGLGPPQGESSNPQPSSEVVLVLYLAQWFTPTADDHQSTVLMTCEESLPDPYQCRRLEKIDCVLPSMEAFCHRATIKTVCLLQHLGIEAKSFFTFPPPSSHLYTTAPCLLLSSFFCSKLSRQPPRKQICLSLSLCLFPASQEIDLFYWLFPPDWADFTPFPTTGTFY